MNETYALVGATIFDGYDTHENHALLINNDTVAGIVAPSSIAAGTPQITLDAGLLQPGYVDMQVNGGGGTLFNDNPTVDGIKAICQAHGAFGTTALLVTLITDTDSVIDRAIQAAIDAHEQQIPGFLGLHLEGPHLSPAKRGAHDASLMHAMSEGDIQRLLKAAKALPVLMITVAPDVVTPAQIKILSQEGVIVSLGHSDCSYQEAAAAMTAGATAVTHLYNAMSPLNHRDPGLVGAALHHPETFTSLIADGHHVDDVALSIAIRTRSQCNTTCLITDAMSSVGSTLTQLTLNNRTIFRNNGALRLDDGTLAGADIDMHSSVKHLHQSTDASWYDAVRFASNNPAHCLRQENSLGNLRKGASANIVYIDHSKALKAIWSKGRKLTL